MEGFNLMTIDKTNKTVTLSFEAYAELLEAANRYHSLCAAGVDNWEGYGEAEATEEADEIIDRLEKSLATS